MNETRSRPVAGRTKCSPERSHTPSLHPGASPAQCVIQELAAKAGLALNGDRPWDLRVHDDRFYGRVLRDGSLGFGESYMDGWWDAERLDETF